MAADHPHEGKYFPELSSKADVERLQGAHQVAKWAMNNRLVFAPVDFTISNLRILDSCTSDGYWLRDLQDDVDKDHKHSFFGVDIDDTRFPSNLPQGVTLQVQDVNKPWPSEWKKSFDLVHMRFGILAAGSTPHAVIDSLLSLVKPGGWFQSVEPEFSSTEEDPLAARQYIDLLNELQAVRGMTGVVPQIPRWMEEAGFVDVHEEMITFSMGAKSSDPHIAGISMKSTAVAIEGLVARVRSTMLSQLKCMTAEELDTLPARFREDVSKHGGTMLIRTVWGQRPE